MPIKNTIEIEYDDGIPRLFFVTENGSFISPDTSSYDSSLLMYGVIMPYEIIF